MPLFHRIDTVILRVRDVATSAAWYAKSLGFAPIHLSSSEGLVVLGVNGVTSLTLWQRKVGEEAPPPGTTGTFPIFAVQDAAGVRALLEERGVEVGPLADGGGVRFFSIRDPDGNHLEACEVILPPDSTPDEESG